LSLAADLFSTDNPSWVVRATDLAPVRLLQSDKDSLSFAFDVFCEVLLFCNHIRKEEKG
jgi:hypothetical protein